MPFFIQGTPREALADAFNAVMRKALYDYYVSANLARHFHAVGLANVRVKPFLAHTDNLDAHPFWRRFIVEQLPMFVQVGLIEQKMAADLEMLNRKGEFSASFVIQGAVGRKPA